VKKNILIPVIIVVIILVGASVYLLATRKATPTPTNIEPTIEVIPTLTPGEIGLTLKAGPGGRTVVMTVTKTKDLTGIDYELSYEAKGGLPRGAIGRADIKTPGEVVTQEIVLGTCSDVCHYDEGVTSVNLVVKVTKADGKVYQVEQKLDL
jgi:hypothetical protein